MAETNYRVYPYRWVILVTFMLVNLTIQMLWICFAPIAGPAAAFYGVSDLQIGLLAMTFMIVYVPLSIPVSWLIDTYGYRKAVGFGVVLLGVFGILRAVFAVNYTWVLIATIGVAAAQPFLMNAISTVAARWFPIQERATASGLALVASFIGIAIGQVTSPMLLTAYGIPGMLWIFAIANAAAAVIFLVFTRDAPRTPPCPPEQVARALVVDGLKSMLRMKEVWFLLFVFLVGMGIFNGISTWIAGIAEPRGFTIQQAGDLGAFLLLGGIIGAVVLPALSDKTRKRKAFILAGLVMAIPGLLGMIYANRYWEMVLAMFELGFFLVSLAAIGYQYGAEITYPAPEGTTNGLLNLAGQVSVVFIYAMELIKNVEGSFTPSLLFLAVLMVFAVMMMAASRESTLPYAQPAD
jgi:nitrate/nitrite transporter NarK